MSKALTLLLFLGPCGLFGDCDHGGKIKAPDRIPDDARLGTRITEALPSTRFFFSPFYGSDALYVLVYEDPNLDSELRPIEAETITAFAVDPDTRQVRQLPDPPLTPSRGARVWRVLDGAGFLAGAAETGELAYFDGTDWTVVEPPPGYTELDGNILARSADDMLAFRWDGTTAVTHWNGSTWEAFGPDPAAVSEVAPMSWERDEVRLAYLATGSLCTRVWSLDGTTVGDEHCFTDAPVRDIDWNTNGTLQSFQLFAQTEALPPSEWQAIVFDSGVFSTGRVGALPDTVFPAPGSQRVIVLDEPQGVDDPILHERVFFEDGVATGPAMGPFQMRTQCDCNRSADIDCECVVRGPVVWTARYHPDTTRGVLLWLDDVDARRGLYARFMDLPATDEPYTSTNPIDFDAGPPVCDVICDPGDTCIFNSLGEKICVPFDMVPEGGVLQVDGGVAPDASDTGALPLGVSLFANVRLTDDTFADVTIEGVDGEPPAPFLIEDEPTSQFVRLSSFADYRVTFSGPGHSPASIEITTEGFDTSINLGEHVLIRGVRIGDSLAGPPDSLSLTYHATTVSPDGDLLLTASASAWILVRRSGGSNDGTEVAGVTPRVVDAFEWLSSTFTPDGAFALVDTSEGLALLRMPAGDVVATLPGGPYNLGQVSFADSAPVFSVRSRTTDMPTGRGEVSVVRYGAAELTELLRVSTEGWREQMRADGAEMVRIEGTDAVVHDIATADTEVITTVSDQSHVMLTFDGRALVAATPLGSGAALRRRCWTEAAGCRLRIVNRVVPGVENVALSGGFHVAATANVVAWQEAGQVGFFDVVSGVRSSVAVAGLRQPTRLGAADRLVVLGSAGPSIVDLPSQAIVASGPAGGGSPREHQRVDGHVFINQSGGDTLHVDPAAGSITSLPALATNGVIAGSYAFPSRGGLVVIPLAGGVAESFGGGLAFGIDSIFVTPLADGAPCVVFDVVDFEPQLTTGLYCAP